MKTLFLLNAVQQILRNITSLHRQMVDILTQLTLLKNAFYLLKAFCQGDKIKGTIYQKSYFTWSFHDFVQILVHFANINTLCDPTFLLCIHKRLYDIHYLVILHGNKCIFNLNEFCPQQIPLLPAISRQSILQLLLQPY